MFENTNVKIGSESEKLNEYREIDFENGVKLIFRVLNDEPSLRFIDKDGKDLIDLLEFAPTGTILESDDAWSAVHDIDEDDKEDAGEDTIRIGKFNNPVDAILSFLHEAGHLHDVENIKTAEDAIEKYSEEKKKDETNAYPQTRLKAMAKAKEAEMKSERNAWAFALKKAREIERRLGINIFDKLEGEGSIAERAKKFSDAHLSTYEKGYLDELYHQDIYTKEEMEKFFEDTLKEQAT